MSEFFKKVKEFVINNKKAVIITSVAVLLAVIVLVIVLLLVGGGKEPANADPTDPTSQTDPADQKVEYKVTLKNQTGAALADVGVSVYTDGTMTEMVWFAKTGEDGTMSFNAKASDGYVAVLEELAPGYAVEETYAVSKDTQIVLSAAGGSITELEAPLSVGDPVPNFTVTTLDGTTYTLSDLITQGKPVVLNFWYENCVPCKQEFPHMQEAYAQYSDKAVLLALNLDDTKEVIEQYQQTSGIDLPFAVGDPCWRDALKIIANPTTAVIDRYGHLSVVHTGTLPDTQVFTSLFAYYTDANYQHTTFQTIDDILAGVPGESPENPLELSGAESYSLTLMPDQTIYCAFYRVDGMQMSIANENVSVIYNGQTYNAVDGYVKLIVNSPDPFTPVSVAIANLGGQKDFNVEFSYVPGSMGAPFELTMGALTTDIAAGNDQGVYYTYTCPANGKLSVAVTGATEGVEYNCVLFNQTTGTMVSSMSDAVVDEQTGIPSISVDVNAGDVVQLVASTMLDASNQFPAATLNLEVSFADGEGTINYAISITDKNGYAIPGVSLTVTGAGVDMDVTTDAEGNAMVALPAGTYTVKPNIPLGYQAEATSFELTEAVPNLSIVLEHVGSLTPDPTDPVDPSIPTEPDVKPTEPDVKPTDPVVKPTEPVVKPTEPVVKPTEPKPTEPQEPTKPTYTPDPNVEGETADNPIFFASVTSFEVKVKAGYTIFVEYRMAEEMSMQITGGDLSLLVNGKDQYSSKNGKITAMVSPDSISIWLRLQFTNDTNEDKTYTVSFVDLPGTMMNPFSLKMGKFECDVEKGNEQGVYYTFTAESDGVLTLSCLDCTDDVLYGLTLYNLNSYKQNVVTSSDDNKISIEVKAGEKVRFTVAAIEDDSGPYPAASFELKASFEEA